MNTRPASVARCTIWLASLGVLCAFAWLRLDVQQPINTDILAALPAQQEPGALRIANERGRDAFINELLILVSGADAPATREAARAAYTALLNAGLHAQDTGATLQPLLAVYQAHHFAMLDAAQTARLTHGGAQALATDVAVSLASPAGLTSSFDADPGGYLSGFLSRLPRPYPAFLPDGPLLTALRDGRRDFLLRVQVSASGFSQQGAALAVHAVDAARNAVRQTCSRCEFQATGAPLFAEAARREAQRETLWLSLSSTVLIMLLIAYVFRSLAPHLLAALQLAASVLAASAAVIACFGSIQILTLVFGTTLLGIAIDYAFLYFAEYWFGESAPPAVWRRVRPGLLMGLLTGVVAFAFLLLAGFPALTQIAVFSVAGLLEAGLVVALIFPLTLTRNPRVAAHAGVRWPQQFIQAGCRPSRWRQVLPALALLLCIPGWLRLQTSDDVRELQHLPPKLLHTDAVIRNTLGELPPPGFFLIAGSDLEQALAREQALFATLDARVPSATPLGLSRFLPPATQQQASLAAWRRVLDAPATLQTAFKNLGLPAALAARLEAQWRSAPRRPLEAAQLFSAAPDLQRLMIPTSTGVALLATVTGRGPLDAATLEQAAAATPATEFVQPLARVTETFHRIRVRATWLVVIGYLVIFALLLWRYGRREALRMLFPPLLALGITLGALGWLREPLNIFVVVALILILGLGRDYSVFLREGGTRQRSPALAVTLSAITMLFSFGLLAVSRIPALHAFGLAALIGILASYLSAPLSLPPARRKTT
ncbi:MAG: MMPL family transporter [Gammaproteobacteria bacterium]